MTEEQVSLVKQSWKDFRNMDALIIGDVFYSKLFIDNPKLRKLFPESMKEQYRKLIDMLSVIVARLDKIDQLTEDVRALAKRHVQYGVRPAHYKLVGNALLWTLQRGLGNEWNPKVEDAWRSCYYELSSLMIAAAEEETV